MPDVKFQLGIKDRYCLLPEGKSTSYFCAAGLLHSFDSI